MALVCTMLSTNDFVHVLSFDFTKAFDTVRYATLMSKMAQLHILDSAYNWIRLLSGPLSLYKICW